MNISDQELKLQAYLDGELSPRESADVAKLLETNSEAKALFEELKWTTSAMEAGEVEVKLPESREFYWSKIAREIELADQVAERRPASKFSWWARILAPVGAAVAVIAGFVILGSHPATQGMFTEVQSSLDEMGTMTFRDQAEGVTMVWVYDRTDEPFTETTSADNVQVQ